MKSSYESQISKFKTKINESEDIIKNLDEKVRSTKGELSASIKESGELSETVQEYEYEIDQLKQRLGKVQGSYEQVVGKSMFCKV